MTAIYRWLVANEIYWALRIADACEGWAFNARQRLRKLSGKLPGDEVLKSRPAAPAPRQEAGE